jgi:hypothetical protein
METVNTPITFESLVVAIHKLHQGCVEQAAKAINISLTLRNWLIGYHICEFEQQGVDRASYGENIIGELAGRLQDLGVKRTDMRELRRYRRFYVVYP